MAPIRVLVADDSVVVRRLISDVINAESDMEVVGVAANGRSAVEAAHRLVPDVITLDVEMPVLDGLGALAEIRRFAPATPVVMFSVATLEGSRHAADAIARGANAVIGKPSGPGGLSNSLDKIRNEVVPQLRVLAERRAATRSLEPMVRADVQSPQATPAVSNPSDAAPMPTQRADGHFARVDCVVVGVSTGGPRALEEIVGQFPSDFPVPVLIVQHMPPTFTVMLATRLARRTPLAVVEAGDDMVLSPGTIYIAPGDRHLVVERQGAAIVTRLNEAPPENSCRPSADVLFRSAVEHFGARVLGVVLTGMGEDGMRGCEVIRHAGGRIIVQDEATSVVWGMPGAVARRGLADAILPLAEVVPEIVERVESGRGASGSNRRRNESP